MEQTIHEPLAATLPATIRHDGWTGEKMAIFCEALAETAVVAEACDKARMAFPALTPTVAEAPSSQLPGTRR